MRTNIFKRVPAAIVRLKPLSCILIFAERKSADREGRIVTHRRGFYRKIYPER